MNCISFLENGCHRISIYFHSFARFKQGMAKGDGTDGENSNSAQSDGPYTQHQKHQQFLGDASGAIPNFGTIETGTVALPDGIDQENIRDFENLYKEHCEASVDTVDSCCYW